MTVAHSPTLTIAAYQGEALSGSVEENLESIHQILVAAQEENIDILCFPECFLQGYILDRSMAMRISLEVNSALFARMLQTVASNTTTIILGMIEREEDRLFNTAVVIEQGMVKGKYRKQHLLTAERVFASGSASPVFETKGVKYGINICSDTRHAASVGNMARDGATLLFFPLNNSLPHAVAEAWKDKHIALWRERARETSCWILTADVVEQSATNTGFGFTTLLNPQGSIVKQLEHFHSGLLIQTITIEEQGSLDTPAC